MLSYISFDRWMLGETSAKWPVLCRVECRTTTQSVQICVDVNDKLSFITQSTRKHQCLQLLKRQFPVDVKILWFCCVFFVADVGVRSLSIAFMSLFNFCICFRQHSNSVLLLTVSVCLSVTSHRECSRWLDQPLLGVLLSVFDMRLSLCHVS